MKPLIGVTVCTRPANDKKREFNKAVGIQYIQDYYIEIVKLGGGVAVLVPLVQDEEDAAAVTSHLDGLILTGGPEDVDPKLYGEENIKSEDVHEGRDTSEILLVKEFRKQQKALLGVCRGIQVINVVLGGTNYQDIPSQIEGCLDHPLDENNKERFHMAAFPSESILTEIFGKDDIRVNSSHHQSIRTPGEGLEVISTAPDGVIEAVQHKSDRCTIGIQWHPERMLNEEPTVEFARWFVKQAMTK